MTEEPAELLLRAALARRRPVVVAEGVATDVHRIPDDFRPLAPLAVRLAFAILPWAVVAALGIALALGPMSLPLQPSVGTPAPSEWDPANPGGGLAEVGWFGEPWVLGLLLIALVEIVSAVQRARLGRPLFPRPHIPRRGVKSGSVKRQSTRESRIMLVGMFAGILLLSSVNSTWEPLGVGSASGPGTGLSEVIHYPRSGTDFIYRVKPNEAFTYLVTVRNNGPVAVTLLGLRRDPTANASPPPARDYVSNGLGLLRDPNVVSADPTNVVSFHPVDLAPDQEVTVVVAWLGGSCANPAGTWHVDTDLEQSSILVRFVYEVAGWRRVGTIYPPFDISVPTTPGCLPPGPFN
jgi:hypothetical protein